MCGRFVQSLSPAEYARSVNLDLFEGTPIGRYNVAPTTGVHVMHQDGDFYVDSVIPWGWKPHWADIGRQAPINARLETVATKPFFRPIWKSGRCIVGADGWYEWKKDPADSKRKQPYFIRLKSGEPLLFAAIGQLPKNNDESDHTGFVILTGAADAGLVDVHDRKPLVLSPDFAVSWLSGDTTPDDALHIAEHQELPAEAFEWFPVSRDVGNVRNKGSQLIERIDDPLL